MDARRELAVELTKALAIAGQRLCWEREAASYYYEVREGVPRVRDGPRKADLATVEMRVMVERRGNAKLEEQLAFNLWKTPDEDWTITGLDKGLGILGPFLEEVRGSQ